MKKLNSNLNYGIWLFGILFLTFNLNVKAQDNKKEIDSITKLIDRCTNCSYQYFRRAKLNLEDGNQMMAMSDLNNAIKIHLEYFDKKAIELTRYYNERANLKLDLKDYRGGILDFDKAVEVGSGTSTLWAEVFFGRAYCKSQLADYEGAVKDYEKVFVHNPDDKVTHYNLGLIKIDLDKKEEGCLHLSKAGELGFKDAYKSISKYCN